jgi:hypothetical protein
MIQVKRRRTTRKTIIPFENEGVLNPAAIKEGDFVHLLSSSAQRQSFKHRVL